MTSNTFKSTAKDVIKLTSALLSKLTNPAGLTLVFLFLAVFYLIPNHQLIGAGADMVYSYSIMFLLMICWALYRKVPLERLDWRAKDILKGKYIKSPRSIHWAFIIAFIAFLLTVAFALVRYHVEKSDMAASLALDTAWQQLLIVTLAEAVIFQGLFPLIIEWELETREKTRAEMMTKAQSHYVAPSPVAILITVIIISQGLFAVSHYTAYGGDWWAIGFAFIPGTLWYLGARFFGIQTAWLSHFGWNCVALGLIGVAPAMMMLIGA
jgi:hypothetical protein